MSPFLSWQPLVGSLRACSFAEMGAPKCIAAARTGFLLAALHSVAQRVSPAQPSPLRWSVPVGPQTAPHASAATIRSSVPLYRAIAACPWVEWIARIGVLVLLFSRSGKCGLLRFLASGPGGDGGRAFRGLTRSATEWSA